MSNDPDRHRIAELKAAIRDTGLPITELAGKVNISHSQLSTFVRGKRTLTLVTAAKLFDKLGLRVTRPTRSPILDVAPPAARPRARRKPAG